MGFGGERWRLRAANVAKDYVAVQLDLGEREPLAEVGRGEGGASAVGDADAEGFGSVSDLDGDGSDRKSVVDGEATGTVGVEGGDGGGGGRVSGGVSGGRPAIGGGEEEAEGSGPEEVGGEEGITGGEIGACGEGHPEAEGEAAGRVGGVGGPEFDVVEAKNGEAVAAGVGPDEAGEAHQLEVLRSLLPHHSLSPSSSLVLALGYRIWIRIAKITEKDRVAYISKEA